MRSGLTIPFVVFSLMSTIPFGARGAESTPVVVGERREFVSGILAETRVLDIALPDGYAESTQAYPVLYLLDANTNFPFTATMIDYLANHETLPGMIVVGIENISRESRDRDFTPTRFAGPAGRYTTAGGADRFLAFLAEELIPFVEAGYRTQPYRILVGHSLGGLFVCHALRERNDLFGAFVSISPSLWWNEWEQMPLLEDFARSRDDLNAFVFITLAGEGDAEDVGRLRELCAAMDRAGGPDFDCRFQTYSDQDHASGAIPATLSALQALYSGWTLPWETITAGLPAIQEHYRGLSRRFRHEIPLTDSTLHHAACSALVGGFYDRAIEMLDYNLARNPQQAATCAVLAEAWLGKGDLAEARRYAQMALAIDADSRKAHEILTRLDQGK